jgi:hypothetical protein
VLGARPTEPDGRTFYYSDYNSEARKGFHRDRWPCCSGTFVQLTADYGISAYMLEANGLYVTLYVPSELRASLGGIEVTLRQITDYPAGDDIVLAVAPRQPARFALNLRIPAWAGAGTAIRLNGEKLGVAAKPGRFARIERIWQPNDRLELHLDQTLRVEALSPSYPGQLALMRGGRVLFATERLGPIPTRAELLAARPHPSEPERWDVRAGGAIVPFRPFTAIGDQPYRLYSPVRA